MRHKVMTLHEEFDLQRRMYEHFDIDLPENSFLHMTGIAVASRTKRMSTKAQRAYDISEAFLQLAEDVDGGPYSASEMSEAIRYKMGYSWLAWFLVKNFAVPIIRWLWREYHGTPPE